MGKKKKGTITIADNAFEIIKDESLEELEKELKGLEEERRTLIEQLDKIDGKIALVEQSIKEKLKTLANLDTFQTLRTKNYTYFSCIKYSYSCDKSKKKEFITVLREHGYGDYIKESFSTRPVVDKIVKDNGSLPDWVLPYVKVTEKEYFSVK